jgi:hypothetical protein
VANQKGDSTASVVHAHEAPRYERWLGISSSACIPLFLTFVLPRTFLTPLLLGSAILLTVGLVLLVRQGLHPERESSRTP